MMNIYLSTWLHLALPYLYTCLAGYSFFVIYRLRVSKRSIWENKNYCEKCNETFNSIYSYPIIGFILCGGKCSNCKQKFGYQHLAMESLVYITVFIVLSKLGFSLTGFLLSTLYLMLALILYDYKCRKDLENNEKLES